MLVLKMQILAPAAIGFAVFVSHLVAVPLDGCSINRESAEPFLSGFPCQHVAVARK